MTFEIYIRENNDIVPFIKSACPFQNFQNEIGNYIDLSGEIHLSFEEERLKIISDSIVSDIFTLLYSINDFIEFDFASIIWGKENVLSYEKMNSQNIKIKMLNYAEIIDRNIFFRAILMISEKFFTYLYNLDSNDKYKMYLEKIEQLKLYLKIDWQ